MACTKMMPVQRSRPPCYDPTRIRRRDLRRPNLPPTNQNEAKENLILTVSDECDTGFQRHMELSSSYNLVHYLNSREVNFSQRKYDVSHATRHLLLHNLMHRRKIHLGSEIDRVLSSMWLDKRRILLGTKCNRLITYDMKERRSTVLCSYPGSGIRALALSPDGKHVATNSVNEKCLVVHRVPDMEIVMAGLKAHANKIVDTIWLDDTHVLSTAHDSKLALWNYDTEVIVEPKLWLSCQVGDQLSTMALNRSYNELIVLGENKYLNVFDATTLRQKMSSMVTTCQDTLAMRFHQERNLYAIGCRTNVLLLDSRCFQCVKRIHSRFPGIGSIAFNSDLMSMGSSIGAMTFYDLRASRYLQYEINSRIIVLHGDRGFLNNGSHSNNCYLPVSSIYTHSYDPSGLRMFVGGGPLCGESFGNFASIWE